MQSSPPQRAWDKPSSPTQSQYSVDVAALDLESRSGATTPIPQQHIDRVRSEDIDGPSDFTLHMEKWIHGGTGTVGRGTNRCAKKGLDSVRETRDEGVQANGSMLTPHKQLNDVESIKSRHTPSNSPPNESVYASTRGLGRIGPDVSEWDPYVDGEQSTPEPPMHKHFLQPTVEDYHSELTPAHLPSFPKMKSVSSRTQVAPDQHEEEEHEPTSPGRPSSETLSPVRSPVRSPERSPVRSPLARRSEARQFSSQSTDTAFEKQMEDLQAKCKQLELLNAALGQAVDEERRMRSQSCDTYEKQIAAAERREREVIEMKDQAYLQRDDYRQDVAQLKAKVELLEGEREESRKTQLLGRQNHDDELRRLLSNAEQRKSEQAAKLREMEEELRLTRRSRDEAEQAERIARDELEQHQLEKTRRQAEAEDEEDELDKMQSDLTQIEDPEDRVHDLEDELHEAREQIEKLRAAKKDVEREASAAKAELANLRRNDDDATTRLASDHRRAVAVAEDLQAQLKKTRDELRTQQTAHKAELEAARADAPQPVATISDVDIQALRAELETTQTEWNVAILERDALTDDLEAQQSKLNAAILERDEAADQLKTTEVSLSELKETLADRDAAATALDTKVAVAIAKRETYWRERKEAWEKERLVMTKALLRQWGREEVGIVETSGGKQGYEYRFVTKVAENAKAGA